MGIEQVKESKRKFKRVDSIEGIDRILSKYVDFKKLFLENDQSAVTVRFLDRLEATRLILNFSEKIKSDHLSLYTVSARYIEFDTDVIEEADKIHPENSYIVNVNACMIAEDKRRFTRIDSRDWELIVNHITVLNMRESPIDIIDSVSFQVFFRECERELADYDYKKLFHQNDEDLTIEKKYAIERGEIFHIEDMNNTEEFFNDNADYFKENHEKQEALKKRFAELNSQYRSLFIRPIDYLAIDGRRFSIGFIMVATKDRILGEDDIQIIDSLADKTYKKIRDANQVMHEVKSRMLDISQAGALMEITNPELGRAISKQNYILFSLIFRLQQPIRISARVANARMSGKTYLIGLDFKGSGFGTGTEKLIEGHIKKHLHENRN